MVKIVIQNRASETVINNVQNEDMAFWSELLHSAMLRGEVQIVDLGTDIHRVA